MNKMKQKEAVMNWLQEYGALTVRMAVTKLNIMSLPKRIEELRKDGKDIRTVYRRSANGKRYGVYVLAKKEADDE
ncbi:MAG: hypothetical protein IKG01_12325 [Lachnospiraceae bacterium]|nr:hypothetical protein [Lachnospiraceae bacterium]